MKETVLITGATSGIGLELAKVFARKKHNLILVARSKTKLNKFQKQLEGKYHVKIKVISKDLTVQESADEIYEELTKENIRVDILVNNAGYGDFGAYADVDWEKQYKMVRLNIEAVMHMTKLFLKPMLERGSGRIMNLSSTAAFQSGPYWAVYTSSKAYVLNFTEALAEECRGTGVTLTALCPGPTKTGFEAAAHMDNSALFKRLKVASAADVAEYGYQSLMKGKVIAVHGPVNKILMIGAKFGPRIMVRRVMANLHGIKK